MCRDPLLRTSGRRGPKWAEVIGRLYAPGDYPAVLVVPGATPEGVDDARVNDLALALARAGRTVFIPELDLYREQFTKADLERIVAVVGGLAERTGQPSAVLGISYGGSLALVAAADPRMEGQLSRVATFGAYYDLEGVIQAVTTGGSTVDDRFIPWEGHPIAEDVLATRPPRCFRRKSRSLSSHQWTTDSTRNTWPPALERCTTFSPTTTPGAHRTSPSDSCLRCAR